MIPKMGKHELGSARRGSGRARLSVVPQAVAKVSALQRLRDAFFRIATTPSPRTPEPEFGWRSASSAAIKIPNDAGFSPWGTFVSLHYTEQSTRPITGAR